MTRCLISLGSNLGTREEQLHQAIERLDQTNGVTVNTVSRWCETLPVGGPPGQESFLNGAAELETTLSATELMRILLDIEAEVGRTRRIHWESRVLDLDLLLYGNEVVQAENVTVPHPRMSFRRFVLEPAAEVAGDMIHPQIGWTIQELLDHLNRPNTWLAVAAPPGINRTRFVQQAALQDGVRSIYLDWPVIPASEASLSWYQDLLQRAIAKQQSVVLEQNQVVVTDFWIPQLLLEAELRLTELQMQDLTAQWHATVEQRIPPSLLLSLEAHPKWLENQFREQYPDLLHEIKSEDLRGYAAHLVQRAQQPQQGPFLSLGVDDSLSQAFIQTEAAIEAMQ